MVKPAFILLALFLLCTAASSDSMPVLTYTNGICFDSDGFDPFSKGNVSLFYINSGAFHPDSCADEMTVKEWSCTAPGKAAQDLYPCPFGMVCRNGACGPVNVLSFYHPEPETCIDSDGLDENTSGYASVHLSDKVSHTLNDTCSGWFNVSEAYCAQDNGISAGKYRLIACANGSFCMDGACVNRTGINAVQVFNVPMMRPVVTVSRTLPHVASAGSDLTVTLKADADPSGFPCAYGISEKVPLAWNISGVSPPGVAGKYPGNGSVRMSEAIAALNAWCLGNATSLDAFSIMEKWRETGIAEGSVEWIIFDPEKNASSHVFGYTLNIPFNASLNSELYGDSTWDGVKYRRTEGNYRMIIQPTVTTTTTTTTTLPVSRVSGIVVLEAEKFPVPGSRVTILCAVNTKVRFETLADEYGYYTTEILCPMASEVSVYASTAPGELCFGSFDCAYYGEAKGSGFGNIIFPGYARIDVFLRE